MDQTTSPAPVIKRHRHELKRRNLTVQTVTAITPHMLRIVLHGADLSDFTSLGFDDHIKLFLDNGSDKPSMREYTPRAYDQAGQTLALDFAIHEAGPATAWALSAKPGDPLLIGGPRKSAVIAPIFDWYLLVGDETALPAIGRRVEELGPETKIITVVAIIGPEEIQNFKTEADHNAYWVYRPQSRADDPAPLLDALQTHPLPGGNGFIWIAAESGVARALRNHVTDTMGHPSQWTKAAGYWTKGLADGSDKALE
ncbi:siderophore-interacting protein [Breoghania sp.]|uniref:siderophore-interacting protein n=1 Tax=Breoghania sp. TaxID=2065378 RepID=UPI002AA94CF7|nr:siderophore-interacting protein [Breoghania sp.]